MLRTQTASCPPFMTMEVGPTVLPAPLKPSVALLVCTPRHADARVALTLLEVLERRQRIVRGASHTAQSTASEPLVGTWLTQWPFQDNLACDVTGRELVCFPPTRRRIKQRKSRHC